MVQKNVLEEAFPRHHAVANASQIKDAKEETKNLIGFLSVKDEGRF